MPMNSSLSLAPLAAGLAVGALLIAACRSETPAPEAPAPLASDVASAVPLSGDVASAVPLSGDVVSAVHGRSSRVPAMVAPPIASLDGSAYEAALRVALPRVPPEEETGLHNVYHLSQNIISGSEPLGEEAFQLLHDMGVRTILSVDGKVPDEELAAKYGMEYVHVPIQYRGISDDEMTRIAKTFRERDGPFYVHCYHGKHRGPAAAEIGRLVLDGITREQALAEMRQWCGTAESYEGLYRTIAGAQVPSVGETDRYAWDFPAAERASGFRELMIEVSRADDNLKYLSKHEWQPGDDHPDVDAGNESFKLADALDAAARLDEVTEKPADFVGWMQDTVEQSAALRDAIRAVSAGTGTSADVAAAYKLLSASCSACHDVYRND
jgi:hypothetical protein